MIEISAKERKKILKSLRGGTVPNQGILRLAVGRNNELNAILKDCEDISEGLNSFRIFIGDYGTGKTFLLSLAREYAQKKNICTCHADLDPQKRLHSNKGDALSLYRQLISNFIIEEVTTDTKFIDLSGLIPDGSQVSSMKIEPCLES